MKWGRRSNRNKRLNWKKLAAVLCCTVWIFVGLSPAAALDGVSIITDQESGESVGELLSDVQPAWAADTTSVPATPAELQVGGKSAVLMEQSSGKVLYEKNAHEKMPIASVTKVMTLLLIMEAIDEGTVSLTDAVTCSQHAASMGGSQIWLEYGESMTVHELLKAIAVVSANDACAMMAEHISGSEEGFVARMNERAAALGMHDTLFTDCSGLDEKGYACAYDVALMSRELMRHELITQYTTIWMDTLRGGKSQLVNTNKLVRFYPGTTGLKTGTTSKAGHCLSATAKREGMDLVAVILGCTTTDERFGGARKMLDYGFANYAIYTPTVDKTLLKPIKVLRGVEREVMPEMSALSPLLIKKGQDKHITQTLELAESVEAPVLKNQIIGKLVLSLDGNALVSYDICATKDIPRMGLFQALWCLILALIA